MKQNVNHEEAKNVLCTRLFF